MPEKNPKKETVKINLPPKPDRAPTIKIPVYKAKNSEAGFDKKSKKFSYVVMNTEGKEERGEIIAPDQNTAIERLKQMGYFPTKVVEATTKKKLAEKDSFAPDKRKERILDLKEKIADTRRKLKENQAGRQEDNHLIEGLREKLSKIKTVSPPTEIEEEKEAEHADLSGPQKMLDLLKKEEKKLELELEKTSKIRFLKRRRLEIDLGNLKFQIDELESKEKRKEGETMEKLSGDSEGTETEAGRQIREQIEEMRRDTERMEKEREDREKAEAEKQRQSAEALRIDKEKNPFKWFMLDQMSAQAFRCLFFKNRESATLEDINTLFKELGSEERARKYQEQQLSQFEGNKS